MPSIYLNHVKVAEESGGVVSLPNTVQFNNLKIGGTEVINSNRQIQNITGIDFSPSSGTGTPSSNLLDDYEEGTFTPTFFGSVAAGTPSGTTYGYYTKVGNLVFVLVRLESVSLTGASGELYLGNLPFTINSSTRNESTAAVTTFGFNFDNTKRLTMVGNPGSTTIFGLESASGGSWSGWPVTNSSGMYLTFSMTYRT